MGAQTPAADKPGCQDHPLFPTRMPEYRLVDCKIQDFGLYEFNSPKGTKTPIEGKFTFITYQFTGPGANEPSPLAILRNYENAIKNVGGTILNTMPNYYVNGKIIKDGQMAWVEAFRGNGRSG